MSPKLFVDTRTGSKDLIEPFRELNIEVEPLKMESSDVAFFGRGVAGKDMFIGIERKRLDSTDFITSVRSGRLAGEQLPKMLGPEGAFDRAWLVVEGQWKTDRFGRMIVKQNRGWKELPGNVLTSEIEKHLFTLMERGLNVRFTNTRDDTVHFVVDLLRWWTDKDLDRHGSDRQVHRPLGFLRLSDFIETVSRFPGVGLSYATAAQKTFGNSVRRAANGTVDEWASVVTTARDGTTRRLGIKTAEKIVTWLRGE